MNDRTIQSKSLTGNRIYLPLKAAAIVALLSAAVTPLFSQGIVPFSARYRTGSVITSKKPIVVPGTLVIPASSQIHPEDKGKRAHTNVRFILPAISNPYDVPSTGYGFETPASLACIYSLVPVVAGCNPNTVSAIPTGGGGTIAIVDAYHDPTAAGDLAYFSDQFGIPFSPSKFKVIFASGSQPPVDYTGGWELEEAMDIEYAHAMAPNAMLYLVEAASNYNSDLYAAVRVATNLVVCGKTSCPTGGTGKGEVSMSWGGEEFATEASYDSYFNNPNVVYLASAGDSAGVIYPSASPNVISVGGTSTARSLANASFQREIAWSETGGGVSYYEPIPSYQSGIAAIAGTHRATPDISADANPNTGAWVYNSFPYNNEYYSSNWWWVGGTSLAAPTVTGIINAASAKSGVWAASSKAELTTLYSALAVANKTAYAANFNDVSYGACDYYSGSFSGVGYDLCTGIGSPKGLLGK